MTNETELMPCPFCGATPELMNKQIYPAARCITDGCAMAGNAINAPLWNTRADAQRVPEGFALVPLEPTETMLYSGKDAWNNNYSPFKVGILNAAYKAMIAAAPKQNTPPTPLNDAHHGYLNQQDDPPDAVERGDFVYDETQSDIHKDGSDNRGTHKLEDALETIITHLEGDMEGYVAVSYEHFNTIWEHAANSRVKK